PRPRYPTTWRSKWWFMNWGSPWGPLPSRCNWPIHHATPAWDAERGLFVEPAMPSDPLGILHMTIYTKRLATLDVREVGGPHAGEVRARSLRWPGRALREPSRTA